MVPNIYEREEVITLSYFFSEPKVGDVIVFRHIVPPFIFCKRIKKVTHDKVWVEGDNRKRSIDSRKFGFVDKKNIVGKVIFKL